MTLSTSSRSDPADDSLPFGHGLRRFWHLACAFNATEAINVVLASIDWRRRS